MKEQEPDNFEGMYTGPSRTEQYLLQYFSSRANLVIRSKYPYCLIYNRNWWEVSLWTAKKMMSGNVSHHLDSFRFDARFWGITLESW